MSNLVLLLEDEALIRDLVCTVLTDEGCGVVVCDSYGRLMDLATETPWAMAVADFWGESHEALSDAERAQVVRLAQAVPTILVTGRVWATERVARDLGLVALLRKPFDVDDLCATVTRTFDDGMGARTA